MNSRVNLSKIRRCDQIWEEMETSKGGRMCSKCSHEITDFRGMTDWEIAVIHANSTKKVCGLYDKELIEDSSSSTYSSGFNKIAAVPGILSLLFGSALANGQDNRQGSEFHLEQSYYDNSNKQFSNRQGIETTKDFQVHDSIKIIRGSVIDSNKEPIIGGNIIIEGTSKGTITDIDGSFSLDVTKELSKNESTTLMVSYTGYGNQTIVVNKESFTNKGFEFLMDPIQVQENEMLITFGIQRESLPKRVWRGIKNIFRRKK